MFEEEEALSMLERGAAQQTRAARREVEVQLNVDHGFHTLEVGRISCGPDVPVTNSMMHVSSRGSLASRRILVSLTLSSSLDSAKALLGGIVPAGVQPVRTAFLSLPWGWLDTVAYRCH